MSPNDQNTSRNVPLLFSLSDDMSDASSSTRFGSRAVPILLQSIYATSEATTSAPVAVNNQVTEARTLPPPPYSATTGNTSATASSSRPVLTPTRHSILEQHNPRGTSANLFPTNPPSADDIFSPSSDIERIFALLKNDFGKLAADYTNLQKFRDNILAKARTVEAERRSLATERFKLAEMREHMEGARRVAVVQYVAAANIKDKNAKKEAELYELARKLKIWEQSLREKEKSLSSSSATTA